MRNISGKFLEKIETLFFLIISFVR